MPRANIDTDIIDGWIAGHDDRAVSINKCSIGDDTKWKEVNNYEQKLQTHTDKQK